MNLNRILFALVFLFLLSCSSDDNGGNITTPPDTGGDTDPIDTLENRVPCESGFAGIYPCDGYDLIAHIPLDDFNSASGNDSWGWTDPTTSKEYALIGTNNKLTFVDISDADEPIILGFLPTATTNSSWRDVKVYNNHCFIVSEAPGHGMQVFDLTRLRDVPDAPAEFNADALYTGFGSAHNIVINEDSGFAYAVGAQTLLGGVASFNGGPHFVNIQNPTSPIAAGGYPDDSYSHDAQVVIYSGPDTEHNGKEILIGSNENEVVIVDITDKDNPTQLSVISYPNRGYTHQGWFTEDQRFFLLGDELDEQSFGFKTRTVIFDFQDLDNPILHDNYTGPTNAIDHNGYVKGNLFYLANYTAGVRMINIDNIASGSIQEVGFFDTFPANDNASFNGAWNVYPFFESGNILISDINSGLFIIRKSE